MTRNKEIAGRYRGLRTRQYNKRSFLKVVEREEDEGAKVGLPRGTSSLILMWQPTFVRNGVFASSRLTIPERKVGMLEV